MRTLIVNAAIVMAACLCACRGAREARCPPTSRQVVHPLMNGNETYCELEGMRVGAYTFESPELRIVGNYAHGQRDGVWHFGDPAGGPDGYALAGEVRTRIYENGIAVEGSGRLDGWAFHGRHFKLSRRAEEPNRPLREEWWYECGRLIAFRQVYPDGFIDQCSVDGADPWGDIGEQKSCDHYESCKHWHGAEGGVNTACSSSWAAAAPDYYEECMRRWAVLREEKPNALMAD